MKVAFDERELSGALLCGQVEVNNKPTLMRKTLSGKKTMLVIVDMVKGFCESGALSSERCVRIAPEIKRIAELLPDADKVFVRDCHTEQSAELRYFPKHCIGNESELIGELRGIKGIDVPKNSTDAFVQLLSACNDLLDYDTVIVTGVCTDICVMQLSLSLRAYISEFNGKGNVVVLTEAVETYDSPIHNADLYNMMAIKFMEQSGILVFKKLA